MDPSPRDILNQRLQGRSDGPIDIHTRLLHLALINYALPKERLAQYLPTDRFDIPEFSIGGQRLAMMSAVPFVDVDFHFIRLFPFLKFRFGQTNYRVYVIDRKTGQYSAWFFGTTLGSPLVHIARALWQIPWHHARYQFDCHYNAQAKRYERYRYEVDSDWGRAEIELEDSGEPVTVVDGFPSYDEMKLILTHPVNGYFYRLDGTPGSYSIWHPEMGLTFGRAGRLYFGLYEKLGLLTKEEMGHPHSIFMCPEIEFKVYLPPRKLSE
jgi:hypothetical protein